MKKTCVVILLVLITCECYSQYSRHVSAAYIIRNNGKFEDTQEATSTLFAGMTWSKKVSRKNYSVFSTALCGGFRVSRSGYKMSGTAPFPDKAFYDKYQAYSAESKLIQHIVGAPIGIDIHLTPNPVTAPKDFISLKLMVSGSFLVSSNLEETIDGDFSRSVNLTSYAKKFVPGFTAEAKLLVFMFGVTYQKVTYDLKDGELNINEFVGSPFYEMMSDKGKFNDFYMYIGLEIPLKAKKK